MAATQDHFIEGLEKMSKTIQDEKLIRKEIHCKSWFLNKIKKKYWGGCAPIEIPVETSPAGTVSMGECLPEDPHKGSFDIGRCEKIGRITGSLCLDSKSLRCYGQVGKESYVSLLKDQLPALAKRMLKTVDNLIINDGTVSTVIANPYPVGEADAGTITAGTADGCLYVHCPDEFCPGQQYEISSITLPTPIKVYVTEVCCVSHKVTFQTNKPDGTAPVPADLSIFDTATPGEEVYIRPCGFAAQEACGNMFGSIESILYKGDTLFGINRKKVPQFQSMRYDLSKTITSANALHLVYKTLFKHMDRCSAKDSYELLVPYRFWSVLAEELQHSKEYDNGDCEAFIGYSEITYKSPRGRIKITAVPKMPQDRIWCLDFSTWEWYGDTATKDLDGPMGQPKWHRERGCQYLYYRDIEFSGKLINKSPKNNFTIYIGNNYDDC